MPDVLTNKHNYSGISADAMEDRRVVRKVEFFPVVCALQQLPFFDISRGQVKLIQSGDNQVAHAVSFKDPDRSKRRSVRI